MEIKTNEQYLKKLSRCIAPPTRIGKWADYSETANKDKFLITMTGEPFQLARVHFNLLDQEGVIRTFEKMKCMDYDAEKQRWVWTYDDEAKGLRFATRRKDLPKTGGAIVLGSFYLPEAEALYLDVNSFDRAIAAIQFFDRYLSRECALLSHIQVVNRCFHIREGMFPPEHKSFLDPLVPNAPPDEDSFMREILDDPTLTREEKFSRFQQQILEKSRKPLSLTESLPIHFYTDGITSLQNILAMRTVVARRNLAGDDSFTFANLFQEMSAAGDWQNEQETKSKWR